MRRIWFTAVAGLALAAPAAAVAAHTARPPAKPSLRITGLSVNQQNFRPGTTVTRKAPTNACYYIGGPSQNPYSVQVFVFIHAVKIPRSAPITYDLITPWDHQAVPNSMDLHPKFGNEFYLDRGHGAATVFGGPTGPYDFYRFDDEGTAGNRFNGRYVVTVTAKVHGKLLRARGGLTVACE